MTPDTITPRDPETYPITHPDNDLRHWSPARRASLAKQQRIDELDKLMGQLKDPLSVAFFVAEIARVSALTPLEYAAELKAAQTVKEQ